MGTVKFEGSVVVIDDDLAPWKIKDFSGLQDILDDPDSDGFGQLWEFAVSQKLVEETEDIDQRIEHIGHDEIIGQIVTDATFCENHEALWNQLFQAVVDERGSRLDWYRSVQKITKNKKITLKQFRTYPEPVDIRDAKLIVIDLIIDDDPDPLGKVTAYLDKVYQHRQENHQALPLVILVSRNTAELENHRQEFRQKAHISASMLRILDKAEIRDEASSAIRFELLWQQMLDERDVANRTQTLIKELSHATGDAEKRVRRLMWNLDADALLRMHQACADDSAPFADYLIEFIARSVAWHIRDHQPLGNAIRKVDEGLQERTVGNENGLVRRFHSSSQKDQVAMQELMHQFHWIPWDQISLVKEWGIQGLSSELIQRLPYGAVLSCNSVKPNEKVWVHTTQPCDLLRFEDRFETDSLLFVEGVISPYGEASDSNSKWVVRGLKSGDEFFDLVINLKRTFALPAKECIEKLRSQDAKVIGQLRADITREIGNQLARHISRIDRPRFSDIQIAYYNILIGLRGKAPEFIFDENNNRLKVGAVLRTIPGSKKECFYLLDGFPEAIAMKCEAKFADSGIRATEIANILKNEILKKGSTQLSEHCDIKVIKDAKGAKNNLQKMQTQKAVGIAVVPTEIANQIQN